MRTCDLLGSAEMHRDHFEAAEAWYGRGSEVAEKLNDRGQLAANAQNVGILYQNRAEQTSDPAARSALLHLAVGSVEEGLLIFLETKDHVSAAASYSQLGVLYTILGELDEAEENLLKGLEIRERLNLPEVYKDYANLADIARARGEEKAAAEWQAKWDAKVEELERLERGGGDTEGEAATSADLVQFILALAQAVYAARSAQTALPPEAAEALAQLAEAPPPLGPVGDFLQVLARGEPAPPIPPGLPGEMTEILQKLAESLDA